MYKYDPTHPSNDPVERIGAVSTFYANLLENKHEADRTRGFAQPLSYYIADAIRRAVADLYPATTPAQATASQPSAPQAASLSVKLTEMHESNGNVTWSVLLAKADDAQPWDCHTVYTDTIKGRAEYEADSLKHFLGIGPEPDMLAYDTDAPPPPESGELAKLREYSQDEIVAVARAFAMRNAIACNVDVDDNWDIYGGDYIDDVKFIVGALPQDLAKEG